MKWFAPLTLLAFAACGYADQARSNENSIPRPGGVVYLIDVISQRRNGPEAVDDSVSNAIPENSNAGPKHSYLLVNPIPIEEAGDGVYFRPENGRPLKEPEVEPISNLFNPTLSLFHVNLFYDCTCRIKKNK